MATMSIYTANTIGQQANTYYPSRHIISKATDLQAAVGLDHVTATYQGGQRSSSNFVCSDCVVMDVDNDHTNNPEDWVDPAYLGRALDEVEFYTATSRNHMKPKNGKSARPRFHVYFPVTKISDASEYVGVKKQLACRFGFFDPNATDAARFIYGTNDPEVTYHAGGMLIDQWLSTDLFAAFDDASQAIGEGSRNATMSRFAARVLVRYGVCEQARELFDRKARLCNPPLPDSELETVWGSACKFAAKVASSPGYIDPQKWEQLTSLRPDDYTDVGQADILAAEHLHKIRYSTATKWLVYRGGVWEENELEAQKVVQNFTAAQLAEARNLLGEAEDEMQSSGANATLKQAPSKAKGVAVLTPNQSRAYQRLVDASEYYKFALNRRISRNITATMREAGPVLQVAVADLDTDPYLLNTPDGTYDLRLGLASRRDHDPADLLTKQTSITPSAENMQVWQEMLEVVFQGDQALIDYVQRICGLAAIGKVMVEALVIAYGDGRNGKSTFWNTIARVLGTYSGSMSADTLTAGVRRNVKPELAEARGKRLVIAAETEEGMRLSTSTVKQLASTDKIAAEKKYKDPFAYTPSHTLILYTNHLPRVGAMDVGIWRRLIVIPFEAKIEGENDIKNYAEYLYEHAGGAALAWIMDGAKLIHQENYRLKPPRQVVEASRAYREDNDWLSQFLEDQCKQADGLSERAGELYQEYRVWAQTTTGWVRPMTDFNAALEHAGFVRKKSSKGMFVYGLSLKTGFEK